MTLVIGCLPIWTEVYTNAGNLRKDNNKTVVTDSMAKPYQQTSTLKVTLTLESLDQRVKKLEESFGKHVKRIEAVLLKTRLV